MCDGEVYFHSLFLVQYPARLGWLVREIDVCPRAFADESVLEYVYTAASSYISVARGMRMRLSFMAEADNLFKKMVAMLKKHGVSIQNSIHVYILGMLSSTNRLVAIFTLSIKSNRMVGYRIEIIHILYPNNGL